jgi:hypothetical protein
LIVNASYSGVLCAKMVITAKPRFTIRLCQWRSQDRW